MNFCPAFLTALFLCLSSRASDWPQFLGPARNGSSPEKIPASWKTTETRPLWKKKVGTGFAGPIIVSNTVVLFHRVENAELLTAYDLVTGSEKWQNKATTNYRDDFGFDDGPRATPCFDNGRLYAIGAEGLLRCVDFTTGKEVWSVSTRAQYNLRKGFFGFAPSPLISGDNLFLNLGGENGAGIVALDKNTGKLRWKITDHEAGYSSPVLVPAPVGQEASGVNRVAFFTREGLVIANTKDGSGLLEFPWRARMHASVNAAMPLVLTNLIFITSSYDTGAALLRLKNNRLERVWSGDKSLSCHYATPVHHEGYLYGFHGRQEQSPSFRCIELATGNGAWNDELGAGTVTLAADQLVILRETGELLIADASPNKFAIHTRAQILGTDTRADPALGNGHLLARDKSNLVCIPLK